MHNDYVISEHKVEELNVGSLENVKRLLNRAVKYFHKVARPTYVGPLTIELGVSIRQLQLLVELLEDHNLIRPATDEEIAAMGVWKNKKNPPVVYALLGNARPGLAYD